MYKHLLLYFILGIVGKVFAQISINGKVFQSDGFPIEYFTVRFMADTTSLASGSFIGGQFSSVVPSSVNTIEVAAWGFKPARKPVSTNGDTLHIILMNHLHELGEVNIVASKKNLTVDGDTYTLAVEGTTMAELANINDVLCRVPLLMVNEKNEIAMFGKGNVVVYINNRRIRNKKELEDLNPNSVRDVKLVSSPGARYDADADAVVLIATKDYSGAEVTVRNIATKGRLFSDATNAMLNMRQGATDIHADYTFTTSKDKSYEGSTIDNVQASQRYNDDEETDSKNIAHTYSIVGEHTFSNEHKLSIQFVGWNDCGRAGVEANQKYDTLYDSYSVVTRKKKTDKANHYDIGTGYELKFGKQSKTSVSAIYTTHRVETNTSILEDLQLHDYVFDSKYYAVDAQADFRTFTNNGLSIDLGTKLSVVSNESKSVFGSANESLESVFSYEYDFTERIIGAYYDLGKRVSDVDINAGLRVEYTNFDGNYNYGKVIDTTYYTFAPNLKLTYATESKSKLSFTYRSAISRPSFNNLSPSIRYDNVFYYRRGNPSLLPTITSNITLAWNWDSKFWANLGYRHKRNATIYQYTKAQNDESIEVVLSNHSHIHYILVSAGYNFSKRRFRSTNSISITKPFAMVRLYSGEYRIDRCAYYFKTINDYAINKHLSVNVDFVYNDLGETLLERKDAMYNLSIGAAAYSLDRSLAFSLVVTDILDSYTFKDHREYGCYNVNHRYDPDNTYVRFTIRYRFSSGKTKSIQTIDSNAQTIKRM